MAGNNSFAPWSETQNCFIVQNITSPPKTIFIFNYPINFGCTRDLAKIPGVAQSDIQSSLIKGTLNHKIRTGEIVVVCSDFDLLTFNLNQKSFLQGAGIEKGLQITSDQEAVIRKDDITLIGDVNNINTIFRIPSGKFIYNSIYKIIVYVNGVKQSYLDDYFISESGGVGTGYDTVILTVAPESSVSPPDVITADYYIDNSGS